MPNFATMEKLAPREHQECLSFRGEELIIIDKVQNLPENNAHYSEYVLMITCVSGKIEMTYNRKKIMLHEGELFLSVPGSVLSDYMVSPNFDCKILAIKPSETTIPIELQKQMVNSAFFIKEHPIINFDEDEVSTFLAYYHFLSSRIQHSPHRFYNGEVHTLLNALLLFVIGIMDRNMEETETTTTLRGEQLVEKFVRMVHEDNGKNRFVEYYADRLNISAKYLSALVRNILDRTPTEIIKLVTMKEIERRLRFSDESIKQISNALNFPNTSFFGKYFKQHSGMTPNSYRKKYHH